MKHVFDPFLTTTLSVPCMYSAVWTNGVAQQSNIPATARPTLRARSSATTEKGKKQVASVAVQCAIQLTQAPPLSASRTCFLLGQGCSSSPCSCSIPWRSLRHDLATQADQPLRLDKTREPCNPKPAHRRSISEPDLSPPEKKRHRGQVWPWTRARQIAAACVCLLSRTWSISLAVGAQVDNCLDQLGLRLPIWAQHTCTSTRRRVGSGASPEIQFAGDKSLLHWYCDLQLHCSVLCHDTLDIPCPCHAVPGG
ncbi:hypothetical protein V8C42DRAFT_149359 [Trichoderma barbatum]